jgi:hypothetical protein
MLITASAGLSQLIAPVCSYADWELQLKDADVLHVDVVAVTTDQALELVTRGGKVHYTIPVDIGVRKHFSDGDHESDGSIKKASVDPLVLLVQEIHETFAETRMADFAIANASATWKGTDILISPLRKHLHEFQQFTGIVRVTFEVYKALR